VVTLELTWMQRIPGYSDLQLLRGGECPQAPLERLPIHSVVFLMPLVGLIIPNYLAPLLSLSLRFQNKLSLLKALLFLSIKIFISTLTT